MIRSAAEKKRMTSMKRLKVTIIIAAVLVVAMAIAVGFVLDYVNATTVVDPADGTEYFVREKDNIYKLYDTDKKTVLPTDEQYGYYVTHAQTLISVNPETGEYEIEAVLEDRIAVDNEVVGFNFRRLLFPHIEKKNILSLEVHNDTGTFTFARINEQGDIDPAGDFIIMGSPMTVYDQELFASLYVSAGYTISTRKIEDPIKDAEGKFSEYGLVAQTRYLYDRETGHPVVIDPETGKQTPMEASKITEDMERVTYEYTPAYYVLTDINGNRYKVIIGDKLVTGGGYYVQYVDMSGGVETPREAVYVLSADIGNSLLAPIEDFVTPMITYPMTMNSYFDVEDFIVLRRTESAESETGFDYTETVSFTYIDLTERENTINASVPYVFNENSKSPAAALKGYQPSSNNISSALQSLYSPSCVGVHKFAPTPEDMVECGLWELVVDENGEPKLDDKGEKQYDICAEYTLAFKYDVLDDQNEYVSTVQNMLIVSKPNEQGNYYVFTSLFAPKDGDKESEYLYDYNMIVEVEGHSLSFLEWDPYDWINSSYINFNIAYVESITIQSPDYNAQFILDNSLSDQSKQTNSNLMFVTGSDSKGNNRVTFAQKTVVDYDGVTWVITGSDIKAYSATGTELKITSSVYDYNKLGTQVLTDTGGIKANNGDVVYVYADTVVTEHPDGSREEICRYDSALFRRFYQTLLYATIVDSYPLEESEREKLISGEPMLTLTVKTSDGEVYIYRYYHLTSRKAYITVNGNGGFYVLPTRMQKFISDAQRFFNLEPIEATDKF